MLKIIFNQVVKRLFPGRSMQSLTQSEILKAQNQAIQIMNRTKGKTGEVLDLTGRRIDTSRPIMGGKNIAETEAQVKERLLKTQQETLERLRNKKKTVEDFRDDGDFDPGGMASGGLARVGMFTGGTIGKGAMWFVKNLRQAYRELIEGKAFTNLDPMKREHLKYEILAQIKNIEKGGPIPKDMINAMRRDPRFKDIMKTRSKDPELYEVEEIMLGKSSGKSDMDRMKDIQQKIELEDFDPKDRLPNAKGGLAHILGV